MHARSVTVQVQPGKVDELFSIYENSVQRVNVQQKGCVGSSILVDTETGNGVMQIFWTTAADMLSAEKNACVADHFAQITPILTSPLATEHYEV